MLLLYFVSPRERPWRHRVFWRKTLVIARPTCVFAHAFKKEHRDWRIKDASCSVYPWAGSVTSRSFSWWDKVYWMSDSLNFNDSYSPIAVLDSTSSWQTRVVNGKPLLSATLASWADTHKIDVTEKDKMADLYSCLMKSRPPEPGQNVALKQVSVLLTTQTVLYFTLLRDWWRVNVWLYLFLVTRC